MNMAMYHYGIDTAQQADSVKHQYAPFPNGGEPDDRYDRSEV